MSDLFHRIACRRISTLNDGSVGRVVCYQRLLTDEERTLLEDPPMLLAAVVRLDFDIDKQIPWYELGELAHRVVTAVLSELPLHAIPIAEAGKLATAFIEASGPMARFHSNMKYEFRDRGWGWGTALSSASGQTLLEALEAGVIALTDERVTLLWVVDED